MPVYAKYLVSGGTLEQRRSVLFNWQLNDQYGMIARSHQGNESILVLYTDHDDVIPPFDELRQGPFKKQYTIGEKDWVFSRCDGASIGPAGERCRDAPVIALSAAMQMDPEIKTKALLMSLAGSNSTKAPAPK